MSILKNVNKDTVSVNDILLLPVDKIENSLMIRLIVDKIENDKIRVKLFNDNSVRIF
jgi:hypothetical protein